MRICLQIRFFVPYSSLKSLHLRIWWRRARAVIIIYILFVPLRLWTFGQFISASLFLPFGIPDHFLPVPLVHRLSVAVTLPPHSGQLLFFMSCLSPFACDGFADSPFFHPNMGWSDITWSLFFYKFLSLSILFVTEINCLLTLSCYFMPLF